MRDIGGEESLMEREFGQIPTEEGSRVTGTME